MRPEPLRWPTRSSSASARSGSAAPDGYDSAPSSNEERAMRVTVVGSGFVGQTTAMRLLERGLGDVVLIDIVEGLPQGLALDLRQSAPVVGFEPAITGTNDYADTAD